jgi:subtilisin family serine protease
MNLSLASAPQLTLTFNKFGVNNALQPFAFTHSVALRDILKLTADSLRNNPEKTKELVAELRKDPQVEYAELNLIMRSQIVPNDPYYSSSGAWGQSFRDLWGIQKISAETAWNTSTGQDVIVAVSDTGVDYNHEDIAGNIWQNPGETGLDSQNRDKKTNGVDDDNNGFVDDWHGWDFVTFDGTPAENDPMDENGHGTHVAGTIAATGNNGIGIIGVAYGARIMPVRGLDASGFGSTEDLVKTILYAADNGAKVINASWGGFADEPEQTLIDAIAYAHDTKGVVVVAAAGNSTSDVGTQKRGFTPANIRNVITVSAYDHTDTIASFSNFGQKIDVAAPGGGDSGNIFVPHRSILSLLSSAAKADLTESGQLIVGGKYLRQAGTSMASPHAAGVAALIRSLHPEFLPEQVRQALRLGSDDVDAPAFDINSGYGRINAAKSLTISSPLAAQLMGPVATITDVCSVSINGAVGGAGLSNWRLEFGSGTSPTSWTQIASSTTSVTGLLTNWNITDLPDGAYTLHLVAQNLGGQLFEDRLGVNIDDVFITGPSSDSYFRSATSIVIQGTASGCTFSSYTIKIKRVSDGQLLSNPVISLTNGGLQKVQAAVLGIWDTTNVSDDRYDIILEVRQTNGSVAQKSTRVLITSHLVAQLGEPSKSSVKLADLDGDGKSEVIVTTLENNPFLPGAQGSGRIHVLSSSGSELPGWPVTLSFCPLNNTAAVGDIDGDGRLDIVVQTFGDTSQPLGATNPRKVWAFTATGVLKPGFPAAIGPIGDGWSTGLASSDELPSLALSDLTGDGVPEIIAITMGSGFGTDAGVVAALKGNGTLLFRTTLPRSVPPGRFFDEWPHHSVPMIGNLTGDASPEIVVGIRADAPSPPYTTFFALTATGNLLPGWPVRLEGTNFGNGTIDTGVLGDLNRDGHDEFIVTSVEGISISGTARHKLYVFDGSGQGMSGFPKELPGTGDTTSYPALADVDHDSFLDIVTFEDADLSNQSQDINYYLVAHNRLGQLVSQTAWPAINNNLFGQGFHQLRLALAEDATGQVCAVFPVPQFPPNQANLQLNARCLNGQVVPGFPITLPSLCDSFLCRSDATSVSLARDSGSTQVYSVLIDQISGRIWRWDIFNSTRPIPWGQFQHDAANAGLTRNPQTLTVARAGTGSGTVSSSLSGISCGATCSADFNSGTVLALTASANSGSSFTGWTGDCAGSGGCQVTMSQARNVTATFTLTPPLQLLLDESGQASTQVAALDSVLFLRDPFPVVNGADLLNLGVDRNTRVLLFVMNLQLAQGETSASVVVNLIDNNNQSYDVAAEDVRLVPNFQFTQVIFRLPNNLPAGTCTIIVKAHGQFSNAGTIRIRI